ncbi:MAG: threonine/serine dehydratase [Leptolyngbyaceae cyanobacterium MO_188.B28]|nr:threonine/serine dehydratase [Leptolyngbyaceae cyanobacterium MO_188.B28]
MSHLTLSDFEAVRSRIAPHVRCTPLVEVGALKQPLPVINPVQLKLECMQVTGSFKPRGAVNKLLSTPSDQIKRGIVTASGGNHGLAVAYAGWIAKTPTTIFLARNTPAIKAEKLKQWGAQVVIEGAVWDDANRAAMAMAADEQRPYFHPFADPLVIAGQGTLSLEILAESPDVDTLLVAIGGGGLISGVSAAAKALKPDIRVIGVEPVGAATLHDSLQAARIVELSAINTAANTLAPRRTERINFEIIQNHVDEVVLVTDDQMETAARWLWFEMGVAAELSGAATVAALLAGKYKPGASEQVCALVCGAGTDGIAALAHPLAQ